MKKVFLMLSFLLFTIVLFPDNLKTVPVEKVDCVEQAFNVMEDMLDAGFSEEVAAFWGEMAYCWCEPNCYTENDY